MAPLLLGAVKAAAAGPPAAAKTAAKAVPNFTGEWRLERSENLQAFMRAIGYSALIAQTAGLAEAEQIIEQRGNELRCRSETYPPLSPVRFTVFHVGGEEKVKTSDDVGREMLLVNPTWNGDRLAAGLRYLKPAHELRIERYMEDGCMVEHLRYPGKGVEMRRVFRKSR